MKKLLMIAMACLLVLLAACGTANTAPASEAPAEPAAETSGDGQNPVMNFVGVYGAGKGSILVEAEGERGAKITVTWANGAAEKSQWSMSGEFDEETLSVAYSNCTKTDLVFTDDVSDPVETVVYTDGTGRIVFAGERYALSWEDDQEHIADGTAFLGGQQPAEEPEQAENAAAEEDPDYYSPVTAMEKSEVERLAAAVREAYLAEDWAAIAGMIRYPINMYPDVKVNNAEEFLAYMDGKTVHESDRAVMEAESCRNMFFNGQGICFGDGEIWMNDIHYMTDEPPVLEIVAVSGIVEK
ncbi:MAG: hypothetical protein IJI06_04615 [Oscillospiraceae bacterium]|nr:hypothetical protein [Oscillospiraceae bacterium]